MTAGREQAPELIYDSEERRAIWIFFVGAIVCTGIDNSNTLTVITRKDYNRIKAKNEIAMHLSVFDLLRGTGVAMPKSEYRYPPEI